MIDNDNFEERLKHAGEIIILPILPHFLARIFQDQIGLFLKTTIQIDDYESSIFRHLTASEVQMLVSEQNRLNNFFEEALAECIREKRYDIVHKMLLMHPTYEIDDKLKKEMAILQKADDITS